MIKLLIVLLQLLVFSIGHLSAQHADPVKKANKINEKNSNAGTVDEDVASFLVKSADARMMDKQEGAMAAKKGTTAGIRQYGLLMVKDQTMLLKKIQILANSKHISLPTGISNKKEQGREDLSEKTGKDFDEKFIKMMQLDHERDVKLFKQATSLKDKDINQFAVKYLPLIQVHLDKIKKLKQDNS